MENHTQNIWLQWIVNRQRVAVQLSLIELRAFSQRHNKHLWIWLYVELHIQNAFSMKTIRAHCKCSCILNSTHRIVYLFFSSIYTQTHHTITQAFKSNRLNTFTANHTNHIYLSDVKADWQFKTSLMYTECGTLTVKHNRFDIYNEVYSPFYLYLSIELLLCRLFTDNWCLYLIFTDVIDCQQNNSIYQVYHDNCCKNCEKNEG